MADNTNTNKIVHYPEVVGSNDTDKSEKVYEVEQLISVLAAIIEKYSGQLDTAPTQRKAG